MTSQWLNPGPNGTWFAPAFSDRHCHPLFAAREQAALDLTGLRDTSAIIEALRAHLTGNPETAWLDAAPFERTVANEFLATTLDVVSETIPITLHSADHHALWVNSAALRIAGLHEHPPTLTDGRIELLPDGKAAGLLSEWSAMKLVLDHQPTPTLEVDVENLRRADSLLASNGVASASDAWIDKGMAEVYLAAAEANQLELKYELWIRVSHDALDEQLEYLQAILPLAAGSTQNSVSISGVKIFLDGVLSSNTAAVLDAYPDGSFGGLIWTDDEIDRLLALVAKIDPTLRPHFHAIGDAAVRQALNAIERARANRIWSGDRKPVVAHAELVSASDTLRFASLDVEVVISPQWLEEYAPVAVGHNLHAHQHRVGDFAPLLRPGTCVTYASDWPVSRPNPFDAIASGARHLVAHGWTPESAVEELWRIASGPEWNSGKIIQVSMNPFEAAKIDLSALNSIRVIAH